MKETALESEPAALEVDDLPSPTGAKTLALLDLMASHPEGLTAAEAARRSGFSQNLVYRILKTMVATGFAVQREDNKAYGLSNRLLELSGPRVGERSLTLCAHEGLAWLRDETGETVQLVIEAGGKQLRGEHPLQVSGRVGMRVPLYSCAPGKAILAGWNETRRAAWFRDRGRALKSFTPNTLSRRADLEADLETSRARGWAADRAEGVEGIYCVAVSIDDEYGQPVGAITVMAPAARLMEDEFPRVAETCREAKRRIEERLKQ